MEVRHRTDSPWQTWSSVPELCCVEGAVSLPAWGTAPGIRKTPNPFRSHTNTSRGAAPGSIRRFLLSAVNVIVGLSHTAVHALKARSGMDLFKSESGNSRFASRAKLVSFRSVQDLAIPQKPTGASRMSGRHFPAALVLSILFLAALWFLLCRHLSGEWFVNEQYGFGWFVPFFALYLLWLRWQDRPPLNVRGQKSEVRSRTLIASAIAIVSLFLLLPVRLFEIANPEWRPLAWIHAIAVVTLTLLLIWYAGGERWLRHFAFPVAFIFVAVPWPTLVETPVIQGLMRLVAHVAAETAMLLGIPAQVEGNLIRVSSGLIGVNEACSGIRSLQTSLMIGLLFGELKRLSVLRRVALVAGAIGIALFANFIRAVFLVMVAATKNISEVTRWHDIAGYTIVALVFVGTMGLAYLLGRSEIRNQKSEIRDQQSVVSSQWSVVSSQWSVVQCRFRRSPVLALLCRDRNSDMVSRPRNQSCQRRALECAMARTGAQLSQTEYRPGNSRCPPV